MDKPIQSRKKTAAAKKEGINFDTEENNEIAIKKKALVLNEPPVKTQSDPPIMSKPIVNNPAPIFNNNPPAEIKKEMPKPSEVKKEPTKPMETKNDNGILKENPVENLGGNKKKALFSDSDSDNSDDDDPQKRELRERIAKMHSKKLNI